VFAVLGNLHSIAISCKTAFFAAFDQLFAPENMD
jgi:hypothetical protein